MARQRARSASASRRRADRLEGGDVEEVDLRAVHRVDVEGGQIGVHDETLDDQRVLQRGARHRIGVLAELSEPPIEVVEPSAPRVEGVRSTRPRGGRRTADRRSRWRRSGGARGTRSRSRRRAGRAWWVRRRWSPGHRTDAPGGATPVRCQRGIWVVCGTGPSARPCPSSGASPSGFIASPASPRLGILVGDRVAQICVLDLLDTVLRAIGGPSVHLLRDTDASAAPRSRASSRRPPPPAPAAASSGRSARRR